MTAQFGSAEWYEELNLLEKQIRIARDESAAMYRKNDEAWGRIPVQISGECRCCGPITDLNADHEAAEDGHCGWCKGGHCTTFGRVLHRNWDSRGDMIADLIRVGSPVLFVLAMIAALVTR